MGKKNSATSILKQLQDLSNYAFIKSREIFKYLHLENIQKKAGKIFQRETQFALFHFTHFPTNFAGYQQKLNVQIMHS